MSDDLMDRLIQAHEMDRLLAEMVAAGKAVASFEAIGGTDAEWVAVLNEAHRTRDAYIAAINRAGEAEAVLIADDDIIPF